MRLVLQILLNGLGLASIVALATLGIVLIFRTSKATNFAQGTIGTFNAYIAAYFMRVHGHSIWLSTVLALVAAFLTGLIIDKLFIRPARKANPVSKQILTLGIILLLIGIMNLTWGILNQVFPSVTHFPDPFIRAGRANFLGVSVEWNTLFIFAMTMVLMAFVFWFIQFTRWGLATRVTASNEPVARLMGVPTKTVTMFSWAFAAMLGSLAGIALAPTAGLTPAMMIGVQVSAFFACVFGGFSTFYGPVIAAYIIGSALNLSRYFIPPLLNMESRVVADVIVYVLILIVLLFMPYGLFGKKPIRKV